MATTMANKDKTPRCSECDEKLDARAKSICDDCLAEALKGIEEEFDN